jgi:hypothetical protein
MRFSARHLLTVAALSFSTLACGGKAGLGGVLPSDDAVSIRVPGTQASGLSATSQGLVGQSSEFYIHTYRISRFLNGHVVGLLGHLRAITSQPATSTQGDVSTWGPYTPGGLEPLTYRLTATKVSDHVYNLSLEGRPRRSTSDADYRALLDGQVTGSGADDGRGMGDLELHFDNAAAINPGVLERGTIHIGYNAMTQPRTVAVDFLQFASDEGTPADATYRYSENEDHSGTFLFSVAANIHRAQDQHPGLETLTLRSTWVESGAGRGDVTVEGAEVAEQMQSVGLTETSVKATECWGEDFSVVFQETLPQALESDIRPRQGDPTACAVAQADFPAASANH